MGFTFRKRLRQFLTSPALFFLVGACFGLPAAALQADSGYRSHVPPRTVTFNEPTPAFDPENPDRRLGDFQTGLSAVFREARPADGRWLVEYQRLHQDNILALIPIPTLAEPASPGFRQIVGVLEQFPLLHRLLETSNPWAPDWLDSPGPILSPSIAVGIGSGARPNRFTCATPHHNRAWGLEPIHLYYDVSHAERPKFVAEFWSKGEAIRRPNFRDEPARNELRRNLQQIASFFDPSGNSAHRERGSHPYIRGLRDNVEIFLLPNDTRVSLHYQRGEYLFLEIEPASAADRQQTIARSPSELAAHLRQAVAANEDGIVFVGGIPMIDQGRTAYCVPATMTRVLNFYGYDVNTHSLAMLAGTMEQGPSPFSGGTTQDDMMRAMRRITNGSPFRLREVRDASPAGIKQVVTSGTPVIWLINGHLRLLIGIHPRTGEIAYSDSWGAGHDFKTMPYQQFARMNRGMWVMEPR